MGGFLRNLASLRSWTLGTWKDGMHVAGLVYGHPVFPDGTEISTVADGGVVEVAGRTYVRSAGASYELVGPGFPHVQGD